MIIEVYINLLKFHENRSIVANKMKSEKNVNLGENFKISKCGNILRAGKRKGRKYFGSENFRSMRYLIISLKKKKSEYLKLEQKQTSSKAEMLSQTIFRARFVVPRPEN